MGRGENTHTQATFTPARFATSALTPPDRSQGFRIRECSEGALRGCKLILPTQRKYHWKDAERPFRSAVVSPEGEVVSLALPKFFNAGEAAAKADAAHLSKTLQNSQPVWCEEKIDGSLIIRSVVGGEVIFRTRGTFDGAAHGAVARRVADMLYPALLDPAVHPDRSLLFELTTSDPELQGVITQTEDELTFLDSVAHTDGALLDEGEKAALAHELGLRQAPRIELEGSLADWRKEISAWPGTREGVVARWDGGQRLIKLKSDAYLQLHAMKSGITAESVEEILREHKLSTEDELAKHLQETGADWETITEARALARPVIEAREEARERFGALEDRVDLLFIQNPGNRKAVLAEINAFEDEAERQAALLLADDQIDAAAASFERGLVERARRAQN